MPYYLITSDQIIYSNSSTSPGTGWVSTTFSATVNQAISSNLPLFILPATISIAPLSVTITSGSANRLMMTATPGTVTIALNANGLYLFEVNNIPDVVIDGIIFDAQNHNLTENVGGQGSGIVRVTGTASTNVAINNCKMINAVNNVANNPQAGIVVDSSTVRITNTSIYNVGYGILSYTSQIYIRKCNILYGSTSISGALDNGIVIFHPSLGADGSIIEDNTITQQSGSSTSASNGNYGNGILVYQGGLVRVLNNLISGCHLSAIRVNAAFYTEVLGNNIAGPVETAIFIECPGSGSTNNGGVVANNIINGGGQGISVANIGLASDGVSKFFNVNNNNVFNITQNTVPNETSLTPGVGIVITGYTIAVGNIIQNCAICGIVVGTNNAAVDLICNGNYVDSCQMGIAYSANSDAGKRLICNNIISNFKFSASPSTSGYQYSGAIVSATYGQTMSYGVNISPNTNYLRDSNGTSSNPDYGNANVQTSSLLIANNIAS